MALAADDVPVFPVEEDGKRPACPNGFHDATTDRAQIDAWWSENPNFNIGVCPDHAGWIVVDLDVSAEKDGTGTWAKLCAENGWRDDTYTVETPSGGRHLYFAGSGPSTAGKLGTGIDTRGAGGYVLVPPSRVNSKPYRVLRNHDLAAIPSGVEVALATGANAVRASLEELDTGAAIARGRSLLIDLTRRGAVAVAGRGGNSRTYALACELLNLGLSPEMAREMLTDIWNPACVPPWSDDELRDIIDHASRYAQNEAGAWAVPPAADAFGETVDRLLAAAPQPEQRRNRFLTVAQQATMPDPVWLIKDVVMEASICLFVGAWRSYKSFLALDLALSISTGTQCCFGELPARAGPVIYACLEGMVGIAKARRRAWCIGHSLDADADVPFFLGPAPLLNDNEDCQHFLEDIRAICERPALIVLDTTSQMMAGLDETRDAGMFIRFCHELARATGACVIAIHHFGHDRGKGARGGTVYPAGFDTYLEGEAKGERRVEVWVRKQKDAEERRSPFAMQGRKVGPALVFYPVSNKDHNEAIAASDPFSWQSVGAALEALNARGRDNAVASAVLAQQIFPRLQGEGERNHAARLARAGKALGALAKNRLRAYCEQGAVSLLWFLPLSEETGTA